jgi:hypothetical protein
VAAVWITRFINATNTPIRVSATDGTWRPRVSGRQLAVGEEMTIASQRLTDTTTTAVPWNDALVAGGTGPGNARAQSEGWAAVLKFLNSRLR